MKEAIFYEARDWGLVEIRREKVDMRSQTYHFPVMNNMSAVTIGSVPVATSFREEIYERIGQLPTGEMMYLKK